MCCHQLDTHQTFDISPELSGWASINDTGLYWVSQERTCYSVWCSLLKTKCVHAMWARLSCIGTLVRRVRRADVTVCYPSTSGM